MFSEGCLSNVTRFFNQMRPDVIHHVEIRVGKFSATGNLHRIQIRNVMASQFIRNITWQKISASLGSSMLSFLKSCIVA